MLRFWPIAPKPVGDDAVSSTAEQNKTHLTGRRVKMKYVGVRGRQSKRRPKRGPLPSSPSEKYGVKDAPLFEEGSVTLHHLGERSESEQKIYDISVPRSEENWKADLDCGVNYTKTAGYGGGPTNLNGSGGLADLNGEISSTGSSNSVTKIMSPCDVEALKKCLEENKDDQTKCRSQIEAFKSTCSIKKPKPLSRFDF